MPSFTKALVGLALTGLAASQVCPPQGAVLPAPRKPGSSESVKKASGALRSALDKRFEAIQASGISVGVKSIHEDSPLFDYHFTPQVAEDIGTEKIDADTIYRVGSVSKLIPTLAVLQQKGVNLDASVLEYVPELQGDSDDGISGTVWEDVTIRGLMSHMSGIATDTAFDLTLLPNGPWTDLGLPKVEPGQGLTCAGVSGTKPCGREDIISHLKKAPPTFSPYSSPSYSNSAIALLSIIVEEITGQGFDEVANGIFDKVGMQSTSFGGPVDSFAEYGFVPKGDPLWNSTLGVYEYAGGMFSSTNDILSFGSAILSYDLLSARKTKAWLQPSAFVPSLGQAVGAPWEIYRSDDLTSDGHTVDVYTKSGDLGLYHAYIALVPEYDLVISVLTGGSEVTQDHAARTRILSAVVSSFMPALEQAAREEVSSGHGQVGTYADTKTNSTLVLELNEGPGLLVTEFTVRGVDVFSNIDRYSITSSAPPSGNGTDNAPSGAEKRQSEDAAAPMEVRLYPAQRQVKGQSAWIAEIHVALEPEAKAELEKDIFFSDPSCDSWFSVDRSRYNFKSILTFVFETCKEGSVAAVSNPAFDVRLKKTSD